MRMLRLARHLVDTVVPPRVSVTGDIHVYSCSRRRLGFSGWAYWFDTESGVEAVGQGTSDGYVVSLASVSGRHADIIFAVADPDRWGAVVTYHTDSVEVVLIRDGRYRYQPLDGAAVPDPDGGDRVLDDAYAALDAAYARWGYDPPPEGRAAIEAAQRAVDDAAAPMRARVRRDLDASVDLPPQRIRELLDEMDRRERQ